MRIVFFDLDRTLIRRNSATLWLRAELAAGRITPRQALRVAGWLLRYRLGFRDFAEPIRRSVAALAGEEEARVRERAERFYQEELRGLYRPEALAAVADHRRRGDRLVLLTSASCYVAELVCRDAGLHDHLSNRFEVDAEGRYTGRPVEPVCFGEGKVLLARRYCERFGTSLAEAVFYSDSYSDRPMLEAVGHPVVVDPDPRLRRLARRRGWTIAAWGR